MIADKPKVCLISLGCAKNQVDSEHLLGLIDEADYPIVSAIEAADIAVLNTCGFVQPAVEESIDEILELCARKHSGRLSPSFCLPPGNSQSPPW